MWPFNRRKSIDVNKPITNEALKEAFKTFNSNKKEDTLQTVIDELKKANFLVLVDKNGLNVSKTSESNDSTIEPGSVIAFLKTFDQNNDSFLPLFTDWEEIDLWVESRENIVGRIMTTKEAFEFVLRNQKDKGLVINPRSDKWTMDKIQIANFSKEI
jgi:SseB protein N-terminal domain